VTARAAGAKAGSSQHVHPLKEESHTPRRRAPVIGLLGGVASGKSFVAGQLVNLGAVLLDADRAGHDVLREAEVKAALRQRWGEGVFGADGEIDRRAVSRIVFAPSPAGPPELEFLEQVTHPRITERLRRQMAEAAAAGAPAVALDAAVMLRGGWDRLCDTVWFVDAPRAARIERAGQRGWSEAQFAAREAAQESLEEKRRRAAAMIDNSGSPRETARQVRALWEQMMSARSAE
jgi:dephospho-CoA kinase